MSEGRGDEKLVARAETLVARAELREPDYDALAKRIEGALADAGKTDDGLLLPPLPESVEDGRLTVEEATEAAREPVAADARTVERETLPSGAVAATPADKPVSESDGASLADLARAALARREARDAVSLAKESLAIASQKRTAAAPTIETEDTRERARRTLPPVRKSRPALDTRGPWIGVGVAAIGLAAGFGLYLSGQRRGPETIQLPVAETPPQPAPQVAAKATAEHGPTTPPVTPDMLPRDRGEKASEPPVLTPEALAREGSPAKATSNGAEGRGATSAERVATAAPSPAAATGAAKPEKIVLDEDHAAARGAAAPATKPAAPAGLRPAELNANGGMADRPSTGAAQAAVGAVLGAARSCIAGQPQGSSATLVFGSSGEVTSVSVSGPAEGTPAAGCIQSALRKARVQPFAAPSFSLGVTVRPP